MLIDNVWADASTGELIDVTDPSTGAFIETIPRGSAEDANRAIQAAAAAFPGWRRLPMVHRTGLQRNFAAKLRENTDRIAAALNKELGRPFPLCQREIGRAADLLDHFADEGDRLADTWANEAKADAVVLHQPVGVVVAIAPFNYPVNLILMKIGAALIAGCTVVAKPAEDTPLSTLMLGELALEVGYPPGVLNIVTGFGGEIGAALVNHPTPRKIAFTGGTQAGKIIAAVAAERLKRVTLELGGQSPAIVCADADLDAAASAIVRFGFSNSGQFCYRVARVLAQGSIVGELEHKIAVLTNNLRVGSGHDPDVDMGPLIGTRILNLAKRHVQDALDHGARLVTGGQQLVGGIFDKGCYFPPTVLADCSPDMMVMTQEAFSPVIGITTFGTTDEAISLANGTDYGLAAFVFSRDLEQARHIAGEIDAGSVWINDIRRSRHDMPFGGMKLSGIGREKGAYGIKAYLELKSVYLPG